MDRSRRLESSAELQGRNSRVARDWVVELVGLEPTTRMLWNVGLSDQLTLSDTRDSSLKSSAPFPQKEKSSVARECVLKATSHNLTVVRLLPR